MSKLCLVLFALLLGGCATLDTARGFVRDKEAKISSQLLLDAEWLVCVKSSIGSVKQRYGQTVERASTYKDFCDGDAKANIVAPK